jgi:hypothetical protein
MTSYVKPLLISGALLSLSAGGALADPYDYDGRAHHIWRDRHALSRDAAHVREERSELYAAERKWRWAWRHYNGYVARQAAHEIREERAELASAQRKYNAQRRDLAEDRAEYYGSHPRRHWWNY